MESFVTVWMVGKRSSRSRPLRRNAPWSAGFVLATLAGSAWAGSVAYTYDSLGRLTQASYAGSIDLAYTYDATGNRSRIVVTGASASATALSTPVPATDTVVPTKAAAGFAVSPDAPAAGPVLLPTADQDLAVYGWNVDSDQPQYAVEMVFSGDGGDRLLHLQGYAIASPGEVGLWLNDTLLGYLSPAGRGLLSTPSLWLLPAALQVPGENRVALVPLTEGLVWGVTRLGLYPFDSVWGNQEVERGGDLTHADGLELHVFDQGSGCTAGYLIDLSGWDVDSGGEIAIEFNGTPLVELPPTPEHAWGPGYHLWLAPEMVAAGDNRLSIANRFGSLEPWAVRIDRILPGDNALGAGLPGQAPAAQGVSGVRFLVPTHGEPSHLDVRFYGVGTRGELDLQINDVAVGHAEVTADQGWGETQTFGLPPGLPALFTVDHSRNVRPDDPWGVRIEGWH